MSQEMNEFKFPDEVEVEGTNTENSNPDGFEIEIENDVPPEDRNRKPVDPDVVEAVEEENLEKFNNDQNKALKEAKKIYHMERREKEAALREQQEAIALAKQMIEENKKLKGSLSEGQTALLEQAKKVVSNEVEDAKRRYKLAYESGDSDALVEAQELLTAAKIKMERVNNFKPALQKEEIDVKPAPREVPRQPQPDPKAAKWQSENSWFGSDDEMTSFALGLHTKLIKSGIDPNSDEYYARLNSRIRQVFPENFGLDNNEPETPQQSQSAPRQKSNVVAPATRGTSSSKIKLTPFQVTMAKKFGVSHELMAQKIAELRKGE